MFDKLRSAFSTAAKSLGEKELKEKDVENILFELEISLLESDVAVEVIDDIKSSLKARLVGSKIDRKMIEKFVRDSMISSISGLFDGAGRIDLIDLINAKKSQGKPFLILFVGINGTGKTTSLAKIAYMLRQAKFSVVVAAADTFRAGAIEQLREHTNRLNLKLVAQNYNSDPAAVARDAVLYAGSHRTDCVLIDTAGRMQTSKNLMEQIAKITKVVSPDFKIFVGDSLAGNDTVSQAREFFEHTQFDGSILTKGDADARGGAALSIVKITSTPVLYVGVGQEYADLKPFDKETFLEAVFGSIKDVDASTVPLEPAQADISKPDDTKPEAQLEPAQADISKPDDTKPEAQLEPAQADISKPDDTKPEAQLEPAQADISKPDDTKPEAQLEPAQADISKPDDTKPEVQLEPAQTPDHDPFAGISDEDISSYSRLFDVPEPEDDDESARLAVRMRQWISQGRPKETGSEPVPDTAGIGDVANGANASDANAADNTADDTFDNTSDTADDTTRDTAHAERKHEDEKPKKKRSLFGFSRK